MKKISTLFLAGFLAFGLAACGNSDAIDPGTPNATSTDVEEATEEPTTQQETIEEPESAEGSADECGY